MVGEPAEAFPHHGTNQSVLAAKPKDRAVVIAGQLVRRNDVFTEKHVPFAADMALDPCPVTF